MPMNILSSQEEHAEQLRYSKLAFLQAVIRKWETDLSGSRGKDRVIIVQVCTRISIQQVPYETSPLPSRQRGQTGTAPCQFQTELAD